MKKLLIIFVGIITIFMVGCGKGKITEITFEEYNEMVNNKESFILFIGSHNCNHCAQFKMTLEDVVNDYNVEFKYIDVANLTEEQHQKLSDDIIFTGTPTTVFLQKGVDNSCGLFSCDDDKRVDGALSYDKVISVLKNYGYIKG